MKRLVDGCIIILIFSLLSSCASLPKKPEKITQGDYAYTKEYISALIKKEMKKNNVTGLSIALVDNQNVVWSEGFGWADKASSALL
jgi:CubicO group peptidase (beta-lactamase class C family)